MHVLRLSLRLLQREVRLIFIRRPYAKRLSLYASMLIRCALNKFKPVSHTTPQPRLDLNQTLTFVLAARFFFQLPANYRYLSIFITYNYRTHAFDLTLLTLSEALFKRHSNLLRLNVFRKVVFCCVVDGLNFYAFNMYYIIRGCCI